MARFAVQAFVFRQKNLFKNIRSIANCQRHWCRCKLRKWLQYGMIKAVYFAGTLKVNCRKGVCTDGKFCKSRK